MSESPPPSRLGLSFIRDVVGTVAGFGALVYVLGGVVIAARLAAIHLPTYSVVTQLPRDVVFSTGLSAVVLPAVAVTIPYIYVRSMAGRRLGPSKFRNFNSGWREIIKVVALTVLGVVLLAAVPVVFVLDRADVDDLLILIVIGIAIAWTLIAMHASERIAATTGLEEYHSFRTIALMSALFAAWALAGAAMAQAAAPLPHTRVCVTGHRSYTGLLIGESGSEEFVGSETHRKIVAIPRSRVTETLVGSETDSTDCPR